MSRVKVFEWKSVYETDVQFGQGNGEHQCLSCHDPIEGLEVSITFQDGRPDNEPRHYHHECAPIRFFRTVAA